MSKPARHTTVALHHPPVTIPVVAVCVSLPDTHPSFKKGVVSLCLTACFHSPSLSSLPPSPLFMPAFLWPPPAPLLSDCTGTRIDQRDITPTPGTVATNEREGLMTEGRTPPQVGLFFSVC